MDYRRDFIVSTQLPQGSLRLHYKDNTEFCNKNYVFKFSHMSGEIYLLTIAISVKKLKFILLLLYSIYFPIAFVSYISNSLKFIYSEKFSYKRQI